MPNDRIKRLRYFPGQYLDAEDFQTEQAYHVGHRLRGNRALYFGAGILDGGFRVTINPNPRQIVISPGIGIDGEGHELVLVEPLEIPLRLSAGKKFVTLRYVEQETEQQVVDRDVSDNTRFEEKPDVSFHDNLGDFDNTVEIVLSRIEVDANGNAVGTPDESVRQIAKARVPGDLTIGQGANGVLRTRHIDGKDWRNDDNDDLFLNRDTGKNVVLGFGSAQSSLFVSGNVGIGTTVPGIHRLMVTGGDTRIAAPGQEQALFGLDKLVGLNDLRFYVDDTGTTEVMRLDATGLTVRNGNVGIGTTTPPANYRLMVTGGDTRIASPGQEQALFGLDKLVGFNDLRFYVDDIGSTEIMRLDGTTGLTVLNGKISGKGAFVVGMIIMWSGSVSQIPTGWSLCDGTNNRPDLRGKFVVGYDANDNDYKTLRAQGGKRFQRLTLDQLPYHSHPATATMATPAVLTSLITRVASNNVGGASWGVAKGDSTFLDLRNPPTNQTPYGVEPFNSNSHGHGIDVAPVGSGNSFDIRPQYYVLAYLIYEG